MGDPPASLLDSASALPGHAVTGGLVRELALAHTRLGVGMLSFVLRRCSTTVETLALSSLPAPINASVTFPALTTLEMSWMENDDAGGAAAIVRASPYLQAFSGGCYVPIESVHLRSVPVCLHIFMCVLARHSRDATVWRCLQEADHPRSHHR
jgi:hypothetical protein